MIFMPLSQFVAVWLIRKVHSVVLRVVTVPSTLKRLAIHTVVSTIITALVT